MPLHVPLECRVRMSGRERRKIYMTGELTSQADDGSIITYTTARATFITIDPGAVSQPGSALTAHDCVTSTSPRATGESAVTTGEKETHLSNDPTAATLNDELLQLDLDEGEAALLTDVFHHAASAGGPEVEGFARSPKVDPFTNGFVFPSRNPRF